MEPGKAMATVLWLSLLLFLNPAEAGWEVGDTSQSCTDVCTAKGEFCSDIGNRQLDAEYEITFINVTACEDYKFITDTNSIFWTLQPFVFNFVGIPEYCYLESQASTCAGSSVNARRICCCLSAADGDAASECYVPTTTSTTATSTITQTTSVTTTSKTDTSTLTTSVTATTSVTTTSKTQTTTITTTVSVTTSWTATTTTVTDTTITSYTTSSLTTSLTTSVTTQTTTSVTQSSTSATTSITATTFTTTVSTVTMTSSTKTSITTSATSQTTTMTSATQTTSISTTLTSTTSTTTVTPQANTLITASVSIGSSEIPVADISGFSIGDVILLGNREVVEIVNITLVSSRRLGEESDEEEAYAYTDEVFEDALMEDGSGRRLATSAILEVTPPVARAYSPGNAIANLGPAATYTGSDPITFYGGQKFKFWFPLYEELLMVQTREIKIFGKVFPGPDPSLQWFSDFRVTLVDGTPVARVQVKRGGGNQTSTRCSSRRLDSLEVFLGRAPAPLREMHRRPMEFTAGDDVRFEINCRQQDRPLLASSRTEYMHFETPSIVFLIVAAHAGNEFPADAKLALKYQHLDLLILEMPRKQDFLGVLPEIWGLLPRSAAVEAMLSPPEPEPAPTLCDGDVLTGRNGLSGTCAS